MLSSVSMVISVILRLHMQPDHESGWTNRIRALSSGLGIPGVECRPSAKCTHELFSVRSSRQGICALTYIGAASACSVKHRIPRRAPVALRLLEVHGLRRPRKEIRHHVH
jgi:hypothetical protein